MEAKVEVSLWFPKTCFSARLSHAADDEERQLYTNLSGEKYIPYQPLRIIKTQWQITCQRRKKMLFSKLVFQSF